MIRAVEALRYRALRHVRQELGPFQVLVGPNASGKSTFIDVIGFFRDLLEEGVVAAVSARTPNFHNLVWMNEGDWFELAVEVEAPSLTRYEVRVGMGVDGELGLLAERLFVVAGREEVREPDRQGIFPARPEAPASILSGPGRRPLVRKDESGAVHFFSEREGMALPFRIGPQRVGLANLPEDEERYPTATRVRRYLLEGVHRLALNGEAMRLPSSPGSPRSLLPNGSNLPFVVEDLRQRDPRQFTRWLEHVRTALPGLSDVVTTERPEDRNRYLRVRYDYGLEAPSWMLSDGTLRLLALTLLAYEGGADRVYLIEEPEDGIHPQAVETVFQSLSSAYGRQILCASHSPVMLSLAEPEQVLVFGQKDGATDVVRGDRHPLLADWRRETDLGTLFAAGVLG